MAFLTRIHRFALPPRRWPRFSLSRISLAMGACGFVLILSVTALVAWRERELDFREARAEARGAASSLADHASRLFEVSDLALRTTILAVGDRSWTDIAMAKPLWDKLRTTADALPYIRSLLLVDDTGQLRLGSMAFPTPPLDLSGRRAFALVRAGSDSLVIDDPFIGRLTGHPSFLVARRLTDTEGRFRGMVAGTADLDYFTSYWQNLNLPHDTHVALVKAMEGTVLVRLPVTPPIAATSLPALKAAVVRSPQFGRYEPALGRSGDYHRVGDLPLVLTASFSDVAVEREWRSWFWSVLPFPGGAILALVAVMALARRQSRVEALASRDVYRARAALAASNAQLEHRVAARTAELQESNAEIQRFAYIVSHDLRAPLVNIMGFTSELERLRPTLFTPQSLEAARSEAAREDFDEALGFIKTSIDKMDRLIRAILLLARQGTRVFEPEPLDTDALMRSIADGVAHRAQSAGTEITVGALPRITVDRMAAEQVFANLVDNAVKYLRPGVPGRISVSAEVDGQRAIFRVTDNGRGIHARDHGRVFELFRRSGTQDQPGEGIGLAHVKALVRQLGGTISLQSTFGQGSTFTVVLPTVPEDVRETP